MRTMGPTEALNLLSVNIATLTEHIQNDICLLVGLKPLVRGDSTSVGGVSSISSSFYSKCCSLRVGTISSCRYNKVASRQSRYIGPTFPPDNSIKLLSYTRNDTRNRSICSQFYFFILRFDI